MSAEEARLQRVRFERYREALVETARESGAQAAWDFAGVDWREAATEAIALLAARGSEFTADDLTAMVGSPTSHNAMGAVFRIANRSGLIESVGVRQSTRLLRHGGILRVWRGRRP